jgi:hypothetical protein
MERVAVRRAIEHLHLTPVMFELDGILIVSGRDGHAPDCPCPSLCQMVAKGKDEQGVEYVERPQPTRVELGVGEEGLQKHKQEERPVRPRTVHPMRPTIAAMSIRIGIRWRARKPHCRCASRFSPPSTPRPARRNWIAAARTNSQASPTKILRASSIYEHPPLSIPELGPGIAIASELILDGGHPASPT